MNAPSAAAESHEALAAYAYSYPHKSSYRRLSPPTPLTDAWRDEDLRRLSLYVHVPFCEMRCGFCNLFTQSQPQADLVDAYLSTLARQMFAFKSAVPQARFGQFAVGGGTPTFLGPGQLASLMGAVQDAFELSIRMLPTSVEASPATASPDRLRVLAEFGVERISLGVQSFVAAEACNLGRPQQTSAVHRSLEAIRHCGFPVLNIDLIYGDPCQTRASWLQSLNVALDYRPEEFYLYPLYVRPGTGLARTGQAMAEHRGDLYRAARDRLCEQGYRQSSLRCFRLPLNASPSTYACQRDGMVGLGCGARSYTRSLHYSSEFAVTQPGIRAILQAWVAQSDEELSLATHGIWLSEDEQRRRFLIMSLLQSEGFELADYAARFGSSPLLDFPEVHGLLDQGWLMPTGTRLKLTADGLEHSDRVGPLLYSSAVREKLREFVRL